MTKHEKAVVSLEPCAWRTGDRRCRIPLSGGHRCQWHQHWMRLVDLGTLDRQQREAFAVWWQQFQPYGQYANNPGPWWADVDVLWDALTGVADPPRRTELIDKELFMRRVDVRLYRQQIPLGKSVIERVSGLPLPPWNGDVLEIYARQGAA